MYNQKQIIDIYYLTKKEKLDKNDLLSILPNLYMILNKVELDNNELICTIDELINIRDLKLINKITPEVIDLIIRMTKNELIDLEGTLPFPIILKNIILPYNLNICDKDNSIILFLSQFEVLIDLANKMISKKDLVILDKYNHELKEIINEYRKARKTYENYVLNDVILSTMLLHFTTFLYFKIDKYDYNYSLINEMLINIMCNYQQFIDYCCSLGIHKNFTRPNPSSENIQNEYVLSENMVEYYFNKKKEEEKNKKEVKK